MSGSILSQLVFLVVMRHIFLLLFRPGNQKSDYYFTLQEVAKEHTEFQYTLCSSCPSVNTVHHPGTAVRAGRFILAQCFWLISALHLNFTNCENAGDSGPISQLTRSSGLCLDSPPCTAAWKLSADSELGQEELHTYYKLKQTQCLTPVWDRWYILRSAMKLQGPPTQGHIVSNPVTKDLFLSTLKRGMKTFRTSLLLYFLWEEGRKKNVGGIRTCCEVCFSPTSHWIYLVPRIHLRQVLQSTLSPAHTRGKHHTLPWPVYTPEASTTIHTLFPSHTWARYCCTHSPGEAPEEPFRSSPRPQSHWVQASFWPSLQGKLLAPSAPPTLGRRQSIGRAAGSQSSEPTPDSPPSRRLPAHCWATLASGSRSPWSSGPWWVPRSFFMPSWDIKQGT